MAAKGIVKESIAPESDSLGKYMGDRIKMIRTNCGIERKKMAEMLGVSEVSLYNFEITGIIRGETLRRYLTVLYDMLKVNPSYIILENNEGIDPFIGNGDSLKDLNPMYYENFILNKKVEALNKKLDKIKAKESRA